MHSKTHTKHKMDKLRIKKWLAGYGIKYSKSKQMKSACTAFMSCEKFKSIWSVYKNPSYNKVSAYTQALNFALGLDSTVYGIFHHNPYTFSFGFIIECEKPIFVLITRDNTRAICLDEEI